MKKRTILYLILIINLSCNTKFEKDKWKIGNNYEYPYREMMVDDLLNNYDLENKNLAEVLKLLGNSDDFCDNNQYELGYRIKRIDNTNSERHPVIIKSLVFKLDQSKPYIDSLTPISKVYLTQ